MEAGQVQAHLQQCGVVVHHAAGMPPTAEGRQLVVVYLEPGLEQHDLARLCALKLPGVTSVSFSGHTPTIMFVEGAERVVGGRPGRPRGRDRSHPEIRSG